MAEPIRFWAGPARPAVECEARWGARLSMLVLAFGLMPATAMATHDPAVTDSVTMGAPDTSVASSSDPLPPPMILSAARSIEGDSLRRTPEPPLDQGAALRSWKADSSTIRFEMGARSEVSNESYYEDAF